VTLAASESIGGGLKIGAVLESGFNANGAIDNGGNQSSAGALFNRQSYLYVADSWGQIGLGKQLSPYILSMALTNGGFGTFWVPRLAVNNAAAGSFAAGGVGNASVGFFPANAITYTSPSISGFTVTAMTTAASGTRFNVLNEDRTAQKNDRYSAASVSGNIGDIFVTAAWQKRNSAADDFSADGNGTTGYKGWMLGATVPLMANLSAFGSYDSHKSDVAGSNSVDSYALGLKYMLTEATAVQGGFAANDQTGDARRTVSNLALIHSLSKRSSIYATMGRGKNVGAAVGNFGSDYVGETNTVYGVGVAHTF